MRKGYIKRDGRSKSEESSLATRREPRRLTIPLRHHEALLCPCGRRVPGAHAGRRLCCSPFGKAARWRVSSEGRFHPWLRVRRLLRSETGRREVRARLHLRLPSWERKQVVVGIKTAFRGRKNNMAREWQKHFVWLKKYLYFSRMK